MWLPWIPVDRVGYGYEPRTVTVVSHEMAKPAAARHAVATRYTPRRGRRGGAGRPTTRISRRASPSPSPSPPFPATPSLLLLEYSQQSRRRRGHGGGGAAGRPRGGAGATPQQGAGLLGARPARVRRRAPRPRQGQAPPLALRQLRPRRRRDPAGTRPPRPWTPPGMD